MSKVSALIVDDASFIRDLMKKSLRGLFPGIQLEEAVNGRKAQQILSTQRFDLVLCDWEMPEMSGLELLTWFRQQAEFKAVPFIVTIEEVGDVIVITPKSVFAEKGPTFCVKIELLQSSSTSSFNSSPDGTRPLTLPNESVYP